MEKSITDSFVESSYSGVAFDTLDRRFTVLVSQDGRPTPDYRFSKILRYILS